MAGVGSVFFLDNPGEIVVRGADGDEIGSIQDLVIDPEQGLISHILVSVGGFLGIGERYVPVPFDALSLERDEGGSLVFAVPATQEQLENAPAIDSLNAFPDTVEEGWSEEFDSYWSDVGSMPAEGGVTDTPTP